MRAITLNECIHLNEVFDQEKPTEFISYSNYSNTGRNITYRINDVFNLVVGIESFVGQSEVVECVNKIGKHGKNEPMDILKFLRSLKVNQNTTLVTISFHIAGETGALNGFETFSEYYKSANLVYYNMSCVEDAIHKYMKNEHLGDDIIIHFSPLKSSSERNQETTKRERIYIAYMERKLGNSMGTVHKLPKGGDVFIHL
ncbi:MAG: hypothetical protein ACRDD8_11275 [Bacteroidales bacterium]